MSKPAPGGGGGSQIVIGEERRRSQRVVIRIPVALRYVATSHRSQDEDDSAAKSAAKHGFTTEVFEASTVSVNDHGGMLLSSRSPAAEAVLELQNVRTRDKIHCRVTRTPVVCPEGYLIPVEFLAPAADFWRISFPPSNWKPGEE